MKNFTFNNCISLDSLLLLLKSSNNTEKKRSLKYAVTSITSVTTIMQKKEKEKNKRFFNLKIQLNFTVQNFENFPILI